MSSLTVETLQGASANSNIITVPSGHTLTGPGQVIQVATTRAGPARQTISSTSPVAIADLSISFTPKFASSLILIEAIVAGNHEHVTSCGIFKDGSTTVSTSGYTNRNEPNMQVTTYMGVDGNDWIVNVPLVHYEFAGNTNTRTYAVYTTAAWDGTIRNTYINNRPSNDMASFSYMTVTEIGQ